MEEDLFLLETVAKNGRKWATISKILIGRNEHIVKNRYISILRYMKKKGQQINPNNFQEVLDTYKKLKFELGSPTKKLKFNEITTENLTTKIFLQLDEPIENLHKEENIATKNKTDFLDSPNLSEKSKKEKSPFLNRKDSQTKPIFSLSNFKIPNIYNKTYNSDEEDFLISTTNAINMKTLKRNDSFELDNLSQKMSSMSVSDQILMEADKILTELSINTNIYNSLSGSNSIVKSIANIRNTFTMSNSSDKSLVLMNSGNDHDFFFTNGSNQQKEKNGMFLIHRCDEKLLDNEFYETNLWQNLFTRRPSKCKTQELETLNIFERPQLDQLVTKKKKSQTWKYIFEPNNQKFI